MIVIAIGSNLPHPAFGAPIDVCNAAIHAIEDSGCEVMERSRWFHSAPVPASDQPDFVNGVVSVRTALAPDALLTCLHRIEDRFDRLRSVPNAARTLDLDLIAYHNMVTSAPQNVPKGLRTLSAQGYRTRLAAPLAGRHVTDTHRCLARWAGLSSCRLTEWRL
jgi:2-amino-4-hydroxy-6-hydroxymethyldihydropteridine diphosphokinase